MCLAIPGKVISIDKKTAQVEYPFETRRAMIGTDNVKIGDYVMVQMGIIVKILPEDQALSSIEAWKSLI